MAKSSREKIALIVLALLVAFIGICAYAYMSTGKHWNLAATYVDDTVGSMDGYTVIAYAGTVEPEPEEEIIPVYENGLFGETVEEESEDVNSPDSAPAEDLVGQSDASAEEPSEELNEEPSLSDRFLPLMQEIEAEEPKELYVSDVRIDYETKNAHVLSLDTAHLSRYAEPGLYLIDGKRIAVVGVDSPMTETRYNVIAQFVAQKNADIVIYVTPVLANIPTLNGIDIVLLTSSVDGYSTIGSMVGDTFVLQAPEVGSVGVILITSSNVVSAKVLDEL